jgi:hypothetical protein
MGKRNYMAKSKIRGGTMGNYIWVKLAFLTGVLTAISFGQPNQRFTLIDTTWMAGKVHPCTGDSVMVHEVVYETYAAAAQPSMVYSYTLLGITKEWDHSPYGTELSNFIHGTIGLAGLECGSGGATSLPATAAAATFQQTVFTNVAKPRRASNATTTAAAKPFAKTGSRNAASNPALNDESVTIPNATGQATEAAATTPTETSTESGKAVQLEVAKKEAGIRPTLPPNNVTTDIEWNHFSQKTVTGNNYALRANYNRTLSNEKITLGGTLVVNTMIMLDKLFFNNALNVSGTYLVTETSSLERKVGGSINTFIVDKAFYGTPFGMSIVGSFSDNWFVNQDNIVTYGAMLQQSFVGEIKTTLFTAGVLFGLPIGQRFAANPSAVLAYNLYTAGKNGSVKVASPLMLQPAINCSIYFTRLFSLDLGFKSTLLIEDYNDLIATIGTTILF